MNAYNGFLLSANLDALFDKGLITFDDEGKIVISSMLQKLDIASIGVNTETKPRWIDDQHKPFLEYHREHIFQGN